MSLQLYLGRVAVDADMTVGSHDIATNIVTTSADVGRYCDVLGAGADGSTLVAVITARTSGTITLGYAASVAVTDSTVVIWTPYDAGRYSISGEISSLSNRPGIGFEADRSKNSTLPVVGQPVLLLDLALVPSLPSASMAGDKFGGYVSNVRAANVANSNATNACECVSWEALASQRTTGQPNDGIDPINGKFSGMAAGATFVWLRDNILDADTSKATVVTGPSINEISFDYTDLASAYDSLCQASSDATDTYLWRIDARRNPHFEIQTTVAAPWNISNSDALVDCSVEWTDEKYANVAFVTPQNSTGSTIANDLVKVTQNNTAIDALSAIRGGTGRVEVVVAAGDVNSSMDEQTLADSIAEVSGRVPKTVNYSTFRGGLAAGQLQSIVLTNLGVNDSFLIVSVSLSMPNGVPLWQIQAVNGKIIGDYRSTLADLASGRNGFGIAGGGGGVATALSVAIGAITVALEPNAGTRSIAIQYTPPSPIGAFSGVYVEIEAPDQSAVGQTTLDGAPALDGTTDLSGGKKPYSFGPLAYSVTGSTIAVSIPEPDALLLPMACRARLISYSGPVTNDAATAPTSTFSIPAATVLNPESATAYCQNPTITVDAPVTVAETRRSQSRTTVTVHMTPPSDPKFKGAVYQIRRLNGDLFVQSGVAPDATFDIVFDTPNWQEACTLYAPGSDGTRINPIVPGITPSAKVNVGTLKPSNAAIATASASDVIYIVDPNGAQDWAISLVEWADAQLPKPLRTGNAPARDPHTWYSYLTFQAVDVSGNPAPPEQGGIEVLVASFGYTGDIHSTSNISSYGFQPIGSIYTYAQLRLYAGNRAASGFDDPINSTLQTTCWGGAAYSRQNFGDAPAGVIPATRFDPATLGDGVKKEAGTNKLVAAVGSEFHFVGGDLLMNHIDMSKATNLSAQFQVSGGVTNLINVSANLLLSGLLQIGGGTNKVSLAKFFDTAGTPQLMGFIGDDSGGSGYVGAWFKRCGVGGSGPLSPNFFTDAAGNVAAKAVTIYDLTGAYGFIGDDGAGHRGGWFKQLWIGGTGPANAQLSTDGSGNVSLDGASLVVSKTFGGVTNSLSIAPGNPFAAPLIADNGVGSTLSLGPLGITAEFPGTSLKTTISQTVVKIEDAAHYAQMAPDFLDIDNTVWVAGGKLAKYDGVTTDGMGVPPIYANVVLAAQTASVAAANLRVGGVVAPAGLYRVSVYILTTVAGSAGTVTINILFNDGIAARTDSFVISLAALAYGGTSFVVGNDGVHDIQYSTTVAGATGSPQYAFRVVTERLV